MTALPDSSNFFSSLQTSMSKGQVAHLYGSLGWQVRKCSWVDYEVTCDWAELVIEAENPILMHGSVSSILLHVEELVAPLRTAAISFTAECYGPLPNAELLLAFQS